MSKLSYRRLMNLAGVLALSAGLLFTGGWTAAPTAGAEAGPGESPSGILPGGNLPSADHFVYLPLVANNTISGPQPAGCLSSEEALLAQMVNNYRNANGLPDVPVSKSLVSVAQWHVLDLELNDPVTGECNMHSWSDWHPALWTAVCYTSDHANAAGMWIKPSEITNGVYDDYGYENAYWSSGQATAAGALSGWQSSPGHNAVILELPPWHIFDWHAMGVGIYEHYAVLWFGALADPQGSVGPCP
ncbi:MAG: hypothetical protein JXA78_13495 [Anaerolineales bacterium]|nr:hypothetical protein [Anaerolineales bacterium]